MQWGPLPGAGGGDDRSAWTATSVEFDAGWFVEAASTETPDALEMALDKESLLRQARPHGSTSRPRFAGEVLVTIGNERLAETSTASIPAEGGPDVEIPIGEDWGAGAYVTATLLPARRSGRDPHARTRHRRDLGWSSIRATAAWKSSSTRPTWPPRRASG